MTKGAISWTVGIGLVLLALLAVYLAFSAAKRAPPPPPPMPAPVVDSLPAAAAPPPKRAGRLEPEPRSLRLTLATAEATRARIHLRNSGEEPLGIESIRLVGPGFAVDADACPGKIDPGEVCVVTVGYGPSAQAIVAEGEVLVVNTGSDRVVQIPVIAIVTAPESVVDPLAEARRLLREARADGSRQVSLARPEQPAAAQVRERQADYGPGFARSESSLPVGLERVVLAGTYIEATLESPINTEQPGPVSAVVSRAVHGRHGRLELIPRGSRLLGTYQSIQSQGLGRVVVAWQRVVRPDGAQVLFQAPGADAMGRIGLVGEVDNRLWERFGIALTSALVLGVVDIGGALATPPGQRTTTVGPGGSTLSVTEDQRAGAIRDATRNAVNRVGEAVRDAVRGQVDLRPVATVAKGSLVYAIPTIDLWFRSVGPAMEEAVPVPAAVGAPQPESPAPGALAGVPPQR